jgi:hypothetical protein
MRSIVVLVLLAGCSHPAQPPTRQWCEQYVADLSDRAKQDVKELRSPNPQYAFPQPAPDLTMLVLYNPAGKIAESVCSAAHHDSVADAKQRHLEISSDLSSIDRYIPHTADTQLSDVDAEVMDTLIDDLAKAYTEPVAKPAVDQGQRAPAS